MTRPNIIVVVFDDLAPNTWPHLPLLQAGQWSNWTRFTNGYVDTPQCRPSRASMLSGLTMRRHGLIDNDSDLSTWHAANRDLLLPRLLSRAGYHTALFGKYLNNWHRDRGYAEIPPGWHRWYQKDDTAYAGWNVGDQGAQVTKGSSDVWTTTGTDRSGRQAVTDYATDEVMREAARWVFQVAKEPFFCYVGLPAPHAVPPGESPAPVPSRHASVTFSPVRPPNFNDANLDKCQWMRDRPAIDAAALDALQVGQWRVGQAADEAVYDIHAAANLRGVLGRTVSIVVSDNGYLTGEHRMATKFSAYQPAVATEIWVRHPDAPSALTTDTTSLVSTIDVFPTVCEAAQATPVRSPNGMSLLRRVLHPERAWRDSLMLVFDNTDPARNAPFEMIVTSDRKKLIRYGQHGTYGPADESYDLVADPDELNNLGYDAALGDRLARLKAGMAV